MINPPPGGPGPKSSVSIFGRRVSTDALLLAGASVVAIVLLYRAGQPSSSQALTPTNLAGDGGTFIQPLPTNPLISSAPAPTQDFAVLRQRVTGANAPGYDIGSTELPLYAVGPSGFAGGVALTPYGGQVQLAAPGEQPVTLPWGTGTAQFYAVDVGGQSGYYVAAGDVAGIVHGPGGPGSI